MKASTAFAVLLTAALGACAPKRVASFSELGHVLESDDTVFVTRSDGSRFAAEVVTVTPTSLAVLLDDESLRMLTADEVERVDVRDPLWEGALAGGVVGALIGRQAVSVRAACGPPPTHGCEHEVYAARLFIAGLGAGAGIGVDALIQRRVTVYQARGGGASVRVEPMMAPGTRGVRWRISF